MSEFRKKRWVARTLTVLALLAQIQLFAVPIAMAQVTTGNLQGVVLDPQKSAVAGATVKLTNAETGITKETTTNEEGFFRFSNVQPGPNFTLEVTASGFAPKTLENLPIRLGQENSADVELSVAGSGETVNVTAGAQLIESTQSQLSQNFTTQQLTELPFSGSVDNLALLTPGVITTGDAQFTNGVNFSSNGNRGRSNNFQIDGQDNNDNSVAGPVLGFTNTEAIGEYQIITNNFSAEFGRNSGAQINSITKSGTNEFHGTLFEYHQNSALNARTNTEKKSESAYNFLADNGFPEFESIANRIPNPFLNNRFGGSIGGPIKKEKAFFFATYQRDVQRGEAIIDNLGSGTVTPTAESAQLAARLFPNAATALLVSPDFIGGPTTAQGQGSLLVVPPTFDSDGDGVVDSFAFDESTNFFAPIAFVRDGNRIVPILAGEAVRTRRNDNSADQFISKIDYNLSPNDVIIGRVIIDRNRFPLGTGGSSLAGARMDYRDRTNNLGITYTRTFSSRFVNEARFNYSNLFVTFGDTDSDATGPPQITFSGTQNAFGLLTLGFGTSSGFPQSREVITWQGQDTLSATLGTHAVKVGADIRRQNVDSFFLPFFLGGAVFTGNANAAVSGALPANTFFNPSGTPRTGGTRAFENFLLGRPRTINFALGNARNLTNQNDYFFFVQDDWRVKANLTLNLGLRYEISTTPYNPLIEELNIREADPATAIFPTTFPLESRSFVKLPLDKNNFGPRVGFAWQPDFEFLGDRFRDGRTVIRGGFGIAYDPSFFNIVLNTVTNSPFVARGSLVQVPGSATAVPFPFFPSTTAQLATTPGTNGGDPRLFSRVLVDPNFYNPYTMSWSFGIQQELYKSGVLEVRYVGTRAIGQFQTVNANPRLDFLNAAGQFLTGNPGQFTNGIVTVARAGTNGTFRVDPTFGITQTRTNGAQSTYHGLQTRFETRIGNDTVFNVNYTLSRAIDNASEIFSTGGGGQSIALSQNPFDTSRGERGLSAFHQKHALSANFLYNFPFFKDQEGVMGKLLGGYQINGIILAGSGRPFSPIQAFGGYDLNLTQTARPYGGNPDAPEGTIAFGAFAAANALGDDRAEPGQFILYNTLQPGSLGTVVSAAEALQGARYIYNDFALAAAFGTAAILPNLEAFNIFKSPFGIGRNTVLGEPSATVNLSVFKDTRIDEVRSLELRLEAFNVLNHRNFGVPDAFTEDAVVPGVGVSSFLNPGYNNGGGRTVRVGVRFKF